MEVCSGSSFPLLTAAMRATRQFVHVAASCRLGSFLPFAALRTDDRFRENRPRPCLPKTLVLGT